MWTFLLIYLTIYGGLQAYLGWRVWAAVRIRSVSGIGLAAWLVFMVAAPILVHMLERRNAFRAAQAVGFLAYMWMIISLWVFCFGVAADLWNLGVRAAALGSPERLRLLLGPAKVLQLLLLIMAGLTVWGFVEANCIRIKTVHLRSLRLPPDTTSIRVVQISDLHLGLFMRHRRVNQVCRLIAEAKPDLLLSTGDFIDASGSHVDELAAAWRELSPPLGKFAVLGNHDVYAGIRHSLAFHETCGFRVLREAAVTLGNALIVTGVDDPAAEQRGHFGGTSETAALPRPGPRPFTILLKHRPAVRESSLGRFDLQLSGHAHGGQAFPFTEIVRLVYPRRPGLYEVAPASWLSISPGAGTWGPPLRILARPEVTLLILEPQS